ncbi:hypothetical protein EGR_10248 [Echinococcus granulosus]|uniref:Uncharacterized protein n=1 Tax=Echinococcus granulosus TaxID=6210 RepID=W6U8R1_ECHGR|nr:hypothetical protein EGR_10248 [Echinococcus granulosus]EUB54887.1 hypothetical protein EGR_10248 [Echinococcus granulosus]
MQNWRKGQAAARSHSRPTSLDDMANDPKRNSARLLKLLTLSIPVLYLSLSKL